MANCTDLSPQAKILPPREGVVKYTRLTTTDLGTATHLVAVRKPVRVVHKGGGRGGGREFLLMEWCEERTHVLDLPLWGSSHLHFPPSSHCTLITFTLPHLTLWTAHSVLITSTCTGVKGGLLLPWLPHTPLFHDNGTGHLTLPLGLQVPVPDGAIPELLVWSHVNCPLSLTVTPTLLPLAGKLAVLYTPLLLPWVTAVALSSLAKTQLLGELVILSIMWGATSVGIPPGTDWEQLTVDGLWTTWSVLLIHLVARGLFQMLAGLLNLLTYMLHKCFPRKLSWFVVVVLVVLWAPSTMLCSALGLLCVLGAYTMMATNERHRHVQSLLVCLFILSLPSLFSWIKAIKYSLQLSPDPLFWPVGVASLVSLVLLLLPSCNRCAPWSRVCGPTLHLPLSLDRLLISPPHLLALSLLLYASTHTYRLAYFTIASLVLHLASQSAGLTPSITHSLHLTKS
jgi:hypothetical protein